MASESVSFGSEVGRGLGEDELPPYAAMLAAFHRGHAAELRAMIADLPLRPGDQVLDMACGDGAYTCWLAERVAFVEEHRSDNETVYVHCQNGVSRSVMVVTAYLMKAHGWSRDEALAFVRQRRPLARPNPAFMELLAEWEKRLKERQ